MKKEFVFLLVASLAQIGTANEEWIEECKKQSANIQIHLAGGSWRNLTSDVTSNQFFWIDRTFTCTADPDHFALVRINDQMDSPSDTKTITCGSRRKWAYKGEVVLNVGCYTGTRANWIQKSEEEEKIRKFVMSQHHGAKEDQKDWTWGSTQYEPQKKMQRMASEIQNLLVQPIILFTLSPKRTENEKYEVASNTVKNGIRRRDSKIERNQNGGGSTPWPRACTTITLGHCSYHNHHNATAVASAKPKQRETHTPHSATTQRFIREFFNPPPPEAIDCKRVTNFYLESDHNLKVDRPSSYKWPASLVERLSANSSETIGAGWESSIGQELNFMYFSKRSKRSNNANSIGESSRMEQIVKIMVDQKHVVRVCLLYDFKMSKSAAESHRDCCSAFGEQVMTERSCQIFVILVRST